MLQRDAQHLATLVEDGLYHALEQLLIAAQLAGLVARHTDDGTLHLWRRIEHRLVDHKQIFDIIPCLNQHGKDAVGFIARLGSHAQGYLMLYHARTAGYQLAIVDHLEEYLRGDIIGIVARQHKLLAVEHLG